MDSFLSTPQVSRDSSQASVFVERIASWIDTLEKELNPNQQLLVTALTLSGREIIVKWIGYQNPNLVAISGFSSGHQCTLLLHQESVQLLCVKQPVEQGEERRRIGFQKADGQAQESHLK